ncbi:hypothetical protein PHMEG_00018943 [Phytophthora megakarya]|uniref:Transmembrane protein n=1 Tax=Phytophthora megakarya TaxID=4795 RepID=A0A225VSU1_9STRA|nr:hypothetical protein PHMEG_00018943 [Phytophthora megakarya]
MGDWAEAYYQEQTQARKNRGWKSLLRPSAVAAYLAIAGRIVVGPLALLLLFFATGYLTDATVFIKADESIFAFTERDSSMAGGCTGCLGPCKIVMLKYKLLEDVAITSAPPFFTFTSLPPTESLYDFSSMSAEELAFAAELDKNGTLCQSSKNEWGTSPIVVTGTAQELLNIVHMAKLNLSPQMVRELELAIERADECVTGWTMMSVVRLFQCPATKGSTDFNQVPAVDTHIFPDYTECRPVVEVDVGSKLAYNTNGEDVLAVVPDQLTLFPYSFTSSLPAMSRSAPCDPTKTKNGDTTVVQSYLRAYYGGCRVRHVNTTGIYIEDTCEVSKHWEGYGLMVHSPDDIPLCSTGDVCIHNYFNSLWEWEHYVTADRPDRVGMNLNTFRSRYADTVALSVLPGVVVMQILLMGVVSLYQVMSHKRSVLLTQIWAYRCQNGRMQVIYLAQISYHLVYNSDLYMLGLATGTLTGESLGNLTCCVFAFSYSFVNLVKARSGDQQLDRHFRLIWEAMQLGITLVVGLLLLTWQKAPFESILAQNAEILRKTSARGAKYCGLNDACVLFSVNMPTVIAVLSVGVGLVAVIGSIIMRKMSPRLQVAVRSARLSLGGSNTQNPPAKISVADTKGKKSAMYETDNDNLTSFERNCLGASFHNLFQDCDDIAYVTYNGVRCTTAEALLLTGYLYYGDHIYQASSVMLLLVARLVPSKALRTFNVLLLRWQVDPKQGTLSHAMSCTWYTASSEEHKLAAATPVA